jgi:hypothetical protein
MVEDSWTEWDYPVLQAIARWDNDNSLHRAFLAREEVAKYLADVPPGEEWKVGRSLQRLAEDRLIEVINTMDGTPWPSTVTRITPAGLRRAGAWPNPESLINTLAKGLEETAEQIGVEETEACRLRAAAQAVRDVGLDFSAKVTAELIAKASGLG